MKVAEGGWGVGNLILHGDVGESEKVSGEVFGFGEGLNCRNGAVNRPLCAVVPPTSGVQDTNVGVWGRFELRVFGHLTRLKERGYERNGQASRRKDDIKVGTLGK